MMSFADLGEDVAEGDTGVSKFPSDHGPKSQHTCVLVDYLSNFVEVDRVISPTPWSTMKLRSDCVLWLDQGLSTYRYQTEDMFADTTAFKLFFKHKMKA